MHGLGDASDYGVGAVGYAVVRQESGITQGLVAAKAKLKHSPPRVNLSSHGDNFASECESCPGRDACHRT